jgi:hypothetical protein
MSTDDTGSEPTQVASDAGNTGTQVPPPQDALGVTGSAYSRDEILEWIRGSGTSPASSDALRSTLGALHFQEDHAMFSQPGSKRLILEALVGTRLNYIKLARGYIAGIAANGVVFEPAGSIICSSTISSTITCPAYRVDLLQDGLSSGATCTGHVVSRRLYGKVRPTPRVPSGADPPPRSTGVSVSGGGRLAVSYPMLWGAIGATSIYPYIKTGVREVATVGNPFGWIHRRCLHTGTDFGRGSGARYACCRCHRHTRRDPPRFTLPGWKPDMHNFTRTNSRSTLSLHYYRSLVN